MKWKECPVPELYIANKLPKYHHSLITKLALGVLLIRIEMGRYEKLPFKDRICPSCKGNTIETEEHFLFHCPLYASQREQIMPNESDRNWVKIQHKLFSSGRLVHRMWEIRRGLLMKEKEAKEEKYRENWLAGQSRATQAEATKIGVEILKKQARLKEGKCTGAILRLKLNNIYNSNTDNVTSTKSSTSMLWRQMVLKEANSVNVKNGSSMLCNKMVPKEANNSNTDNVTSIESSTPMLQRQMVSKEENIANVKNVSSMLCNKMVPKEANNRNNANVTSTESSTSMMWRQMVSKEKILLMLTLLIC